MADVKKVKLREDEAKAKQAVVSARQAKYGKKAKAPVAEKAPSRVSRRRS